MRLLSNCIIEQSGRCVCVCVCVCWYRLEMSFVTRLVKMLSQIAQICLSDDLYHPPESVTIRGGRIKACEWVCTCRAHFLKVKRNNIDLLIYLWTTVLFFSKPYYNNYLPYITNAFESNTCTLLTKKRPSQNASS